jgi:nitrite transporter NirC
MYTETVEQFAALSRKKSAYLRKNVIKYFLLSMMAGIYVGFGIVLIFMIGAPVKELGSPFLKAIMGASFGVALTLVIFAGSELFTGNNMTMIIGNLSRTVSVLDTTLVWLVSYAGNLAGALLIAYAMVHSGLIAKEPWSGFITTVSASKMSAPFAELLIRGILCNMLVCLAVWTSARAKEDTAKLVLIFWCLFAFIGSGFEHSVANMSLLGMGVFIGADSAVSWGGFIANLVPVTIGNIIGGGLFIGAAYWFVSRERK